VTKLLAVKFDGDSALLLFIIAIGLIPVVGDLERGRPVGGLTTVAMVLVLWCSWGLLHRARLLFRARSLRRQLLAQERWLP
jgi:hypothetical protein